MGCTHAKIVGFLKNTAEISWCISTWMNGSTRAVIPSAKDDGADLVETSYLLGPALRATIAMALQMKRTFAMTSTRYGTGWNGTGSGRIMKAYYTGIGVLTIIGI
jgi:hypothetical protein